MLSSRNKTSRIKSINAVGASVDGCEVSVVLTDGNDGIVSFSVTVEQGLILAKRLIEQAQVARARAK